MSILSKILGDPNKKILDKLQPIVEKINNLEPELKKLSDGKLKEKTNEFKERLKKGETLDNILPEAFATVREAAKRTLGQRHFDVQILGGIILHQGKIAEMKTGEGKTLVATLPLYLNTLLGKGAHLVTVNDYLAKRDVNWMGPIYNFLGLSIGCIQHEKAFVFNPKAKPDQNEVTIEAENLSEVSRKDAYECDILYGTNNEFGFDYLRDNMAYSLEQIRQRPLHYAIVDEVDSILIDEARTPLIISAPDIESAQLYKTFVGIVPRLKENADFNVDEKMKAVTLTEKGIDKVEKMLGVGNIYQEKGIAYVHHLEQALKAQVLFKRDRDYVVKDGQVIIVDDFTGRLMHGRRYSEGLHQAIEAKEGLVVQRESRTLATITFQNYFRLYDKLSGMTGTAETSAEEFAKVYNLEVVVVPTNKPMIRQNLPDRIYKTEKGKFQALISEIKERHQRGQPVLIGTIAIEKSELLSAMFRKEGLSHEVLNAKHHENEAKIIARAGQQGVITIATNMAGRGTDIKLGQGVVAVGGLHIVGTERHEARRIDNQLRGRTGRQGDPGSSQFFISMEDELMRVFGSDKMKNLMDKLGVPEDQPIENKLISKSIESAQSKIEGYHFDMRKHILEYDDVMNKQREVIYKRRKEILEISSVKPDDADYLKTQEKLKEKILEMIKNEIGQIISVHTNGIRADWNIEEIYEVVNAIFPLPNEVHSQLMNIRDKSDQDEKACQEMADYLFSLAKAAYNAKEKELTPEAMRQVEKVVALRTIDTLWMEHLDVMEEFRRGVGLRGYGQKDPLVEYKKESYGMFQKLLSSIQSGIVSTIYKVGIVQKPAPEVYQAAGIGRSGVTYRGGDETSASISSIIKKKVGRNDPCPCGSGKKYKKCCWPKYG